MKTFFHILLLLVLPLTAQAQDITQTLKGTIYDQNTHEPLIGATVVVQNSDPVIAQLLIKTVISPSQIST